MTAADVAAVWTTAITAGDFYGEGKLDDALTGYSGNAVLLLSEVVTGFSTRHSALRLEAKRTPSSSLSASKAFLT